MIRFNIKPFMRFDDTLCQADREIDVVDPNGVVAQPIK